MLEIKEIVVPHIQRWPASFDRARIKFRFDNAFKKGIVNRYAHG